MYKRLVKQLLFQLSPEAAHEKAVSMMRLPLMSKILGQAYAYNHPSLKRELFGLTFPNPVGLAAGFDKNALLFNELADLGFGFIEIGTVTPKAQAGNPLPRLFRLPEDGAIINRMGFNNDGVTAVVKRLKQRRPGLIIGGNIGKNKVTPNEDAVSDYEICFNALFDLVDYFVVNVSSPNTPNLRALQDREPLTALLSTLQSLNNAKPARKPLLLKIAPDLSDSQLDDIVAIVEETNLDGLIATNTTISRDGLRTPESRLTEIGNGGLSGKPLTERATAVIKYINQKSSGNIPIIGVGGIFSGRDALDKLEAGASLVQIYTGFIYEGPGLIREIKQEIVEEMSEATVV